FVDEVLTNVDDDDAVATMSAAVACGQMSAAVACGHGGDGGNDDPSRPHPLLVGLGFRGVGGRKSTRGGRGGGRDGGRKGVHKATRNIALKEAMERYGPGTDIKKRTKIKTKPSTRME
ncbi:hypothetical protein Tco_1498815, partial [Tanacetum coccineum]